MIQMYFEKKMCPPFLKVDGFCLIILLVFSLSNVIRNPDVAQEKNVKFLYELQDTVLGDKNADTYHDNLYMV